MFVICFHKLPISFILMIAEPEKNLTSERVNFYPCRYFAPQAIRGKIIVKWKFDKKPNTRNLLAWIWQLILPNRQKNKNGLKRKQNILFKIVVRQFDLVTVGILLFFKLDKRTLTTLIMAKISKWNWMLSIQKENQQWK